MEKVKIVADSTCDLSPEVLERYQIEVIPLPVNLGEKPCLDGVDVHPADLFAYVRETGKLPTTSAPTPAYYEDLYRKWTEEGYSVVHFSISLSFTRWIPGIFPRGWGSWPSRLPNCGMRDLARRRLRSGPGR